jgi:hypothetical protein
VKEITSMIEDALDKLNEKESKFNSKKNEKEARHYRII